MKRLHIIPANIGTLAVQYIIIFFSPIAWLLLGVGIMVAFDWVSGVAAARKRGEKILSGGFYRTFVKFSLYAMGIIATRILEILMKDKVNLPFATLLAGFILIVEYKSVMENISLATGVNMWSWVKDKISAFHPKKQK